METATVITQDGTQTVQLPAGFRVEGNEVFVKRVGKSTARAFVRLTYLLDTNICVFVISAKVARRIIAPSAAHGGYRRPLDTMIAAHALSLGSTLVTNNIREFSRVSSLNVEDWTVP